MQSNYFPPLALTFSRASFAEDWTSIWLARAVDVFVSLWASILLLRLSLLLLLQYNPLSFLLLLFDNDDKIDGEQPITIAPLILYVFCARSDPVLRCGAVKELFDIQQLPVAISRAVMVNRIYVRIKLEYISSRRRRPHTAQPLRCSGH